MNEVNSDSSSEDEINPLNQNLQLLAAGPSSNIQSLNAEPSSANLKTFEAESSNIQQPCDAGLLNLNIQIDDAGPLTPSNDARSSSYNLQVNVLKRTNASILTPIGLFA